MADDEETTEESRPDDEEYDPFDREGFDDEHLYEDWDELADDPEKLSRLGKALEGLLPDAVKRGVGELVSEDGLRSMVKERGLTREAAGFILGQVDATKREVLRIVSREVRLFLRDVDLGGELTKILTSVSFEIRTEVRFIPNDASIEPQVKNRVSVQGSEGDEMTLSERDDFEESSPDSEDREESDEGEESDGDSSEESRFSRWRRRRRERTEENDTEETDGDQENEGGS